MKRLFVLAVCLIAVVACVAPERPGPRPSPTAQQVSRLSLDDLREIAKRQYPETRTGFMFDGTADGVVNGGPWNAVHGFPRLVASDGGNEPSRSYNSHLNDLARHHIILWQSDWPNFKNHSASIQDDPFGYIRDLNPGIRFLAALRAYQYTQSLCYNTAVWPHTCAMYTAADTADGATASGDGWYARDAGGGRLQSAAADEWFLNWGIDLDPDSTDSYANWLGQYFASDTWEDTCEGDHCWDGAYLEQALIPHGLGNSRFSYIDGNENGITDLDVAEWDKCTINENQLDGYDLFFDVLASEGITVAGGELSFSGLTDALADPYVDSATAGFIGSFPLETWPRCAVSPHAHTGDYCTPGPDGACFGNKWDYNMRGAVKWEDRDALTVLMSDNAIYDDSYFSTYVADGDENHLRRITVISSLLLNAYAVPREDRLAYQYPCDECLVDPGSGAAGTDIADLGWLGYPYFDAINTTDGLTLRQTISNTDALNNLVWVREFTNGLVVFNATTSTQVVTVGSGWKYINGSSAYGGDHTHNPGGSVSGTTISVPAWDGYVLLRDSASTPTPPATYTPGPTVPTNTPTPTRTPTPTPTRTPTPLPTPTGAPTNTPTPTRTPLPCPALAITIDGSLAEWAGRASQLLSSSNDQYLYPAATPSAADLSAQFWIGCSGSNLMMAGVITDSIMLQPEGDLTNGDALEVLIDGLADGISRPGQDDHDLFVSPDGKAMDYARPLLATVVARTTPGSNWRFEMSVPLSVIWTTLGSGDDIDVTLGLWDRDVAVTTPTPGAPAGPNQVMIGPRQRWTIN